MKPKVRQILMHKDRTIPILSFPSTQLLNTTVSELISSADMQVRGMQAVLERGNLGASLNMMDLSVEAECFGATIHMDQNDVPTVARGVLDDIDDVDDLEVPPIGSGRSGVYIEGVKKAAEAIRDVPVFCGVIGPYSLAGRLFDMTELMMECYDSPEQVHTLLQKCTDFLCAYVRAFKEVGADGVILAEPAAGLLSPALQEEFSAPYVRQIFDAVQSDDFILCYHNCGNAVISMTDSLSALGADIYHFGNAIKLCDIIDKMPADSIVMGNIDPLIFRSGTPADVEAAVQSIYDENCRYNNFMISSGCDIPADASWQNLDAYFAKVTSLYA